MLQIFLVNILTFLFVFCFVFSHNIYCHSSLICSLQLVPSKYAQIVKFEFNICRFFTDDSSFGLYFLTDVWPCLETICCIISSLGSLSMIFNVLLTLLKIHINLDLLGELSVSTLLMLWIVYLISSSLRSLLFYTKILSC